MRTAIVFLLAAGVAHAQAAWKEYGKGVKWEKSLDDAKKRAAAEKKPILFHQLAGDMDKEGC